MNKSNNKNIWRNVPLSEIADINPRMGKTTLAEDCSYAFVPMASVGAANGIIDVSAKRPYAEVKKGFTSFQSGDVLFAKITPCMENGKMAVVPKLENHYGFGSTEFHVIRPKAGIDPKYVYYFVSCSDFRREAGHNMTGAVGQKRVPTDFLKQSTIPLPPTIEDQKQIVSEIEKQFSRLDEAVASLKRIQANLKRYKAAVLKAAVEGKLTEQWRKDHPDVEPADQLLKRINEKRDEWITQAIKERQSEPKTIRSKLLKHKFIIPDGVVLPPKWESASLLSACQMVVDCHNKTAPYEDSGIPLIRTTNVRNGRLLLDGVRYVSEGTYTFWSKRCPPEPGDILFTREAPMGEVTIIPEGAKLCMGQRMMLLRVFDDYVSVKYLFYALQNPAFQAYMNTVAIGTGVKHLRVGDVESLVVPFPPLHEQKEIVEEIESRLSITEELESTIETNLKRAERLRDAVLKNAFSQ